MDIVAVGDTGWLIASSLNGLGAATALEVGGEIWIGTYSGDRVGVLPAP